MTTPETPKADSVRARLLQAAKANFLADDYHQVSTRQIADQAGVNVSMIHYYFGSKEGLYEEMIRETLNPLLEVLDGQMLSSFDGFVDYLRLYYETMVATPEFPKLILKVIALNQGPGRRFIQQLLERGRTRGAERVEALKAAGRISADLDPDILRMAFVSLAMTPILLKGVFEEQMGRPMDADFLGLLARFNGRLIAAGLTSMAPTTDKGQG
ncbi:MAG: TetR/AcrR family transcriptional regulator [Usitatibacteraceae bacterium]